MRVKWIRREGVVEDVRREGVAGKVSGKCGEGGDRMRRDVSWGE